MPSSMNKANENAASTPESKKCKKLSSSYLDMDIDAEFYNPVNMVPRAIAVPVASHPNGYIPLDR